MFLLQVFVVLVSISNIFGLPFLNTLIRTSANAEQLTMRSVKILFDNQSKNSTIAVGPFELISGQNRGSKKLFLSPGTQEFIVFEDSIPNFIGVAGIITFTIDDGGWNENMAGPNRMGLFFSMPAYYIYMQNWFGIKSISGYTSINKELFHTAYDIYKKRTDEEAYCTANESPIIILKDGKRIIIAMSDTYQPVISITVEDEIESIIPSNFATAESTPIVVNITSNNSTKTTLQSSKTAPSTTSLHEDVTSDFLPTEASTPHTIDELSSPTFTQLDISTVFTAVPLIIRHIDDFPITANSTEFLNDQ